MQTRFQIVLVMALFVSLVLPQWAYAGLNECREAAKQAVQDCDEKYDSILNRKVSASAMAPDSRGGASLEELAQANYAQWSDLPEYCQKRKRACASACKASGPAEKQSVDEIKQSCLTDIDRKISQSYAQDQQETGFENIARDLAGSL